VPVTWKVLLVVIFVAVLASIVIGSVKLVTTPVEILGAGFEGLPRSDFPR
jgi:hypothetical protein